MANFNWTTFQPFDCLQVDTAASSGSKNEPSHWHCDPCLWMCIWAWLKHTKTKLKIRFNPKETWDWLHPIEWPLNRCNYPSTLSRWMCRQTKPWSLDIKPPIKTIRDICPKTSQGISKTRSRYIYIYMCVNYNISLTWNKAIWEWFPL